MATPKPTLAVLGASGDVAGWALATALVNGHKCRALARDPDKLSKLLLSRNVPQQLLDDDLVMIKGNAKDKDDVKELVQDGEHSTVDIVLTGIGALIVFEWWSWHLFTLPDPTVCQTSMATLLAVLSELAQDSKSQSRPQLIAVSTTGLTDLAHRDVPWLFLPLYHWLLHVPHADKHQMEEILRGATTEISSATIVRPSLLVDGEGIGLSGIRAGIESDPAIGWTIARKDAGLWIYHNLIGSEEGKWNGKTISLTY